MKELMGFDLEAGGEVLVEVDDTEPGFERVARGDGLALHASRTLEAALEPLRTTAEALFAKVRAIAQPPDEVEVELGIRLNAKAGAVIAASEGEGHFQVRLTWKKASAA